ncbi:hypothetical protein H6A35_00170 [Collinsella tanakaei]|nr:hypothetical protein [Collinsella tanakaei]
MVSYGKGGESMRAIRVVLTRSLTCLLAGVSLLLAQPVYSAGAQEVSECGAEVGSEGIDDITLKAIVRLFEEDQQFLAIDYFGNDISKEFVTKYINDYNKRDWKRLKQVFREEISSVTWESRTVSPKAVLLPTAVREQYLNCRSNDGAYSFGANVVTSIRYQYNDSLNKIVAANSPVVSVVYSTGSPYLNAYTSAVSTWKSISSDGSQLSFGATFSVGMDYAIGGLVEWGGTAGPYSVSYIEKV